jgi:hypothetical protein
MYEEGQLQDSKFAPILQKLTGNCPPSRPGACGMNVLIFAGSMIDCYEENPATHPLKSLIRPRTS